MRPFSSLERRGVCLGLVWGMLTIAAWPGARPWIKYLQLPLATIDRLWVAMQWPGRENIPYMIAILFCMGITYEITYLIYLLGSRNRVQRRTRGNFLATARRTRR